MSEKHKIVNEGRILGVSVELAIRVSALVHETQKERGATAIFVGSQGKKFETGLLSQRSQTDKKIEALDTYMKSIDLSELSLVYINDIKKSIDELNRVKTIRSQVDTLSITKADVLHYYTAMNALFLDSISDLAKVAPDPRIVKFLNSFVNFLYSKERAGIERAIGAGAFSSDSISVKDRIKFSRLISEQDSFLKSFEILESRENIKYYKETLHGEIIDDVNKMREVILNARNIGGFNIDSKYWYEMMTQKITILKEVEDYITSKFSPTSIELIVGIRLTKKLNSIVHETQKERG
ncbi:MAG: nitrate- and nitrite sensing domain-containing protein, partial [Campylobacterota bacterium]|nr:nitrate- and nitrite sensing domain-containing protein [Campylobacterota bacterium]